nr:unnamed protein product [Spirometra erinaceieuropaei]
MKIKVKNRLAFVGVQVTKSADERISTTVYRKIALIVFLVLLSYTLLFELYRTRMSYCEMIVMIYSLGWIVENIYACIGETGTHLTRLDSFFRTFPWIPLYFAADLMFIIAAFCRINMEKDFFVARCAYSLLLILSNAKLLNLMMLSRYYGPLVVMINKMWAQLLNAAIILCIIMIAYGAAVQVLLFPRSNKYNWDLVFNIFYYPYFQLFGEMSFEFYNGKLTSSSSFYSKVFSDLVEQSRNIWLQNRFRIVFYFDRIGVMPAPFSTLHVAYSLLKRLFRLCARHMVKKTGGEGAGGWHGRARTLVSHPKPPGPHGK